MKRKLLFLLLLLWGVGYSSHAQSAQNPSTFLIKTIGANGKQANAFTGFFIDENGTAISRGTGFHKAVKVEVIMADGQSYSIGKVLAFDPATSLVKFSVNKAKGTIAYAVGMPSKGQQAKVEKHNAEGAETIALSLDKAVKFENYGHWALSNKSIEADGAPVIADGKVIGIVADQVIDGKTAIIDAQRIYQLQKVNQKLEDWLPSFRANRNLLIAMEAFDQKDYEKAAATFAKCVRLVGSEFTAYYYGAKAREAKGDLAGARTAYGKALDYKEGELEILQSRGLLSFKIQNFKATIDDLTIVEAAGKASPEALTALGTALYEENQFEQAIIILEKAPKTAESQFQLGNAYFRQKDFDKAIGNYKGAENSGNKEMTLFNNRGKAHLLNGNAAQAKIDLTKALSIDPTYVKAVENRAAAHYALKQWEPTLEDAQNAERMGGEDKKLTLYKGVAAYQLKQYELAAASLKDAVTRGFDEVEILIMKAASEVELKQYNPAIQTYIMAQTAGADDVDFHFKLATVYWKTEQLKPAVAHFKKALVKGKADLELYESLGLSQYEANEVAACIPHLQKAVEMSSQKAEVYTTLGAAMLKEQPDHADLLSILLKAEEMGSTDAQMYQAIGFAYLQKSQAQQAIPYFQKAKAGGASGSALEKSWGLASFQLEQYAEAIQHLEKAIDGGAREPECYQFLGLSLYATEQYKEASAALKMAVKGGVNDPDVLKKLGASAYESGDMKTAVEAFPNSGALKTPTVAGQYGLALYAIRDYDNALIQLNKAEALGYQQADLYETRASLNLKQKEEAAALADYDKAVAAGSNGEEIQMKRAKLAMKLKDYPKATSALDAVIGQNSENSVAYLLRGTAKYRQDQYASAKSDLEKAKSLSEGATPLYEMLGISLYEMGDKTNAKTNMDQAISQGSKNKKVYGLAAEMELKAKNYEKALSLFEEAGRLGYDAPTYYGDRGMCYYQLGKNAPAIDDLNRAINAQPDNPAYLKARGNALFLTNQFEKAATDLAKVGGLTAEEKFRLGRSQYKTKDYVNAEKSLEAATTAGEKTIAAYSDLGAVKVALKKKEEAIAAYSQALAIDANSIEALQGRGLAYYKMSDYEKALTDFLALEQNANAGKEVGAMIGTAYFRLRKYEQAYDRLDMAITQGVKDQEVYLGRGVCLYIQKKYEEAIPDLQRGLKGREDLTGFNALGNAEMFRENEKGAKPALEKAIQLGTQDPLTFYHMGMVQYGARDFRTSLQSLNKAIALQSSYPEAYQQRGDTKFRLKDYEGALTDYNQAVSQGGNNAKLLNNRGKALFMTGDKEKAIAAYTAALDQMPEYPKALENRGVAYYLINDYEKAVVDLRQFEKLTEKQEEEILYYIGECYYHQGDFNIAISYYERTNNKINEPTLYAHLGEARLENEEFEQAIKSLSDAVNKGIKTGDIYRFRSTAYVYLEKYEEALADLTNAIELDPKNPDVYYNRALILEQKGNFRAAIKDYNVAIELNPKDPEMFYNRASLLVEENDLMGAIKDMDLAIGLDDSKANYFLVRGNIKRRLENNQGACEDWQKAASMGDRKAGFMIKQYCK
ncbi:tetratricopeptide repeat protein [Persicobacter diffluens]|uniref:UDP-N-acetylglucosamine--peptide N-acetylglucosaminyltransferase SPINDLY n=1 Tax=Persicobacter diffluens TaxID=981 RepID=A0AAN4VVY2_9BACT|nr:hypothetical protein PEDI_03570 [Persicobacter diffluens]